MPFWLITAVTGLAAILALYLSNPERPLIAILASVLIAGSTAWQTWRDYKNEQTQIHIERHVIDQLSKRVNAFLSVLSDAAVRGADEFIPDTDEKFFSLDMSNLICREINVWESKPVAPGFLAESIAHEARKFGVEIGLMVDAHADHMPIAILEAVTRVKSGSGIGTLQTAAMSHPVDKKYGITRAPLLCWGFEPLVADLLSDVHKLVQSLREARRKYGIEMTEEWLNYPDNYLRKFRGLNRFGPEALAAFRIQNPGAPGPGMFGKGDPNKGTEFDPRSPRPGD